MIINKKVILYLIFTISNLISCSDVKNNRIKEEKHSKVYNNEDALKKSIVLNGNVSAYDELCTKYVKEEQYIDILPYSFIMATEYNHFEAYYDVFYYLYSTNNSCSDHDLSCLDDETKREALKYLRLGIENGDVASSSILLNYYDKGKHYPIKELYTNKKLIEKAKLNLKKSR